MFSKSRIWWSFVGLGLLLSMTSGVAEAQLPPVEMRLSESEANMQFQHIQQPLGLKVGVTVGGMCLIGLELWWFFANSPIKPRHPRNL